MQNDAVVDGKRLGGCVLPVCFRRAPFKEWIAVWIKKRPAVWRQPHGLVFDAGVDCAEGGKKTAPGVVAALKDFFTVLISPFTEQFAQRGNGVVLIVKRVAKQEQAALFGGEKENEAHHHGESAVVKR